MEEIIRLFVGSEPYMRRAEIALEHSIRLANHSPVEITWMDYSRGGLWEDWDIGREHHRPASENGWYTDFTNFRMAIPEAAGFQGKALYMDVDMIVQRDLGDLWARTLPAPVSVPTTMSGTPDPSVILFDCAAFKNLTWWPRIQEMKSNKWPMAHYVELLNAHGFIATLDGEWYSRDGEGYCPSTAIVHFTCMATQPWEPYAHTYKYPSHPRPDMALLWWRTYAEAIESELPSMKNYRLPNTAAQADPIQRQT